MKRHLLLKNIGIVNDNYPAEMCVWQFNYDGRGTALVTYKDDKHLTQVTLKDLNSILFTKDTVYVIEDDNKTDSDSDNL